MTSQQGQPLDDTLTRSEWLGRLAARLATGEASAEDLIQRTWLAALRSPRPEGGGVSARRWLARVLRNEAHQVSRAAGRRRDHERARVEHVEVHAPAAGDVAAEAEAQLVLQRSVLEAVEALKEPYRTVIVLRYLEGVSAAEIARRTEQLPRTVETQLRRGRERLRATLDHRHGTRRAWATIALGSMARPAPLADALPPGALSSSAGSAGGLALLAAMKSKLAGALAVLLLVALAVPLLRGVVGPPRPLGDDPDQRALVDVQTADSNAGEPLSGSAADRVVPSVPAPVEPGQAPAVVRAVEAFVFDGSGAPAPGVLIQWREAGGGPSQQVGVTPVGGVLESDERGTLLVPLGKRRIDLEPADSSLVTLLHRPAVPGRDAQVPPMLMVTRGADFHARVVGPEGEPVPGAAVSIALTSDVGRRVPLVLSLADRTTWSATSDGEGLVSMEGVPASGDAVLTVSMAGYEDREWSSLPAAGLVKDGRPVALELEVTDGALTVQGVVLDRAGRPIEGARVGLGLERQLTGVDGRFRLSRSSELEALRGPQPLVAAAVGLRPVTLLPAQDGAGHGGWPDWIEVRLTEDTLRIEGVVLGSEGDPMPGAEVWIADPTAIGSVSGRLELLERLGSTYGYFWETFRTDQRGRFVVPRLAERNYVLRVIDRSTFLASEGVAVPAGATDAVLRLPGDAGMEELVIDVTDGRGEPLPGAIAQLVRTTMIVGDASGSSARVESLKSDEFVADAAGRCALGRVALLEGTDLRVYRKGFVPSTLPLRSLVLTPEADRLRASVVLDARCEVQIIDGSPEEQRATSFALEAADGTALELVEFEERGVSRSMSSGLTEGRSSVVQVSGAAATLVLRREGEVVESRAIRLVPGEVNVLRR